MEEPNDWLDPERLNARFQQLNIEDFKDNECFIGVDLSITSDLSAIATVFMKDDKYYVFVDYFMANNPSKKMRKGNFDLEPHIGTFIHLSDKGVIDYKALIQRISKIDEDFRVVKLLYDRYNAPFVISEIQETTKVYCEDFAQTPQKFNAPLKFIQDLVESERIIFAFNPVLRWNFSNVVIRVMDTNENLKIDKKKKKEAVDGVVALAQALGGWMQYTNPIYS
jgi:phage terminase large subunit-like protein